jgi:tetratricopeptide (TPR) repeat protein
MQQRVGDYEGAYQRLTYAISLRPDLMLAYSLRSAFRFEEALSLPADAEERQRLIMLSMQDANTSRKLGDQYEINHWLRGMALRELQQTPLAVAAYLDALEREPPLTMLKLSKMSTIFSQQDPNQVRRLSFLMNDRYQQANAFGQQLGENDSDNADYALLEAVAALELVDSSRRDDLFPARRAEFTAALQEAETATQRLLKIIANTSSLDPKVESMAQGCVARSGNIAVNCPRRGTRSLKRCVWTARTHGRLLDWPPRWRSWLRKARILCKPGWPWLPMKSSPTSRLPIGNSCSPTRVAFGCC